MPTNKNCLYRHSFLRNDNTAPVTRDAAFVSYFIFSSYELLSLFLPHPFLSFPPLLSLSSSLSPLLSPFPPLPSPLPYTLFSPTLCLPPAPLSSSRLPPHPPPLSSFSACRIQRHARLNSAQVQGDAAGGADQGVRQAKQLGVDKKECAHGIPDRCVQHARRPPHEESHAGLPCGQNVRYG